MNNIDPEINEMLRHQLANLRVELRECKDGIRLRVELETAQRNLEAEQAAHAETRRRLEEETQEHRGRRGHG